MVKSAHYRPRLAVMALASLIAPSLAVASLADTCSWDPIAIVKPEPFPACALPVDDETWGTVTPVPWVQRPFCIPSEKNEDDKFCTFVAPFQDRPITFITRVNTVSMLSAPVLNPEQKFLSRRHLNGTVAAAIDEPPYRLEAIVEPVDKGYGLVASRFIGKGQLIMVDYPVLLAHVNFGSSVDEKNASALLRSAFGSVDPETQREVRDLTLSTYGSIWEDIVRSNGFVVSPGGFQHIGLFPEVARINHNCVPNAFSRFSPQTYSMEVFATKDIQPGDEIEISYTAMGMPSWTRQRSLKSRGFDCKCQLCTSPPSVLAESDSRRERLKQIKGDLHNGRLEGSDAIDAMTEAVEIIESEDLDLMLGDFYELFSRVYAAMENYSYAKQYAYLGGEWAKTQRGRDDAFVAKIDQYVAELAAKAEKQEEESHGGHAHHHHHDHDHDHDHDHGYGQEEDGEEVDEEPTIGLVAPVDRLAYDITEDGPQPTEGVE